ncbi:MAG: hypothetical protein EBT98_04525 [Opitutaceae bacterium]|nr:hypothetical protein [Opitutaceae bacterium]NBR59837.1 hypothetical protein [Opitutaceae bacterium]
MGQSAAGERAFKLLFKISEAATANDNRVAVTVAPFSDGLGYCWHHLFSLGTAFYQRGHQLALKLACFDPMLVPWEG